MKRVLVLGSTGSIGRTTLRVLEELRNSHQLVGLSAGGNADLLREQVRAWQPPLAGIADASVAVDLREALGADVELVTGSDAAAKLVALSEPDIVVAGISGAAGLEASLETVRRGARLALANKESMVVAGPVLSNLAVEHGAEIVPVDSEHSAIFQCLQGASMSSVRRLLLTASGGPFRNTPADELPHVTPQQALDHPTWDMGAKITIDSATLMNKALEVIEARWLFDVDAEHLDAVVHPQSIIHSMVEFVDGSILAQLGIPDMAVPIRYALTHPERAPTQHRYFDLRKFASLTFEEPDLERFPALRLGFEVARAGGIAGAVLNAANEVAVADFLAGRLPFPKIAETVEETLQKMTQIEHPSLDELLEADRWARAEAAACCS